MDRHFLDYLEDNRIKCEILGIDLDPMVPHRNFRYVNMRSECVDLLDQNDIERIIFDFQPRYILHLASFSSVAFSWKNPTISFKNNVNIFLNLLEVIRKYGLNTRILSIGSSEEYGNVAPEETPLTEIVCRFVRDRYRNYAFVQSHRTRAKRRVRRRFIYSKDIGGQTVG